MSFANGNPVTERSQIPIDDVESTATVVVSTGDGTRFHRRAEWPVFTTACKVEFSQPTREISMSRAIEEGYTPCENPDCFR